MTYDPICLECGERLTDCDRCDLCLETQQNLAELEANMAAHPAHSSELAAPASSSPADPT